MNINSITFFFIGLWVCIAFLLISLNKKKMEERVQKLEERIEKLEYPAPKTFFLPDEVINNPGREN